MEEAFSIIAQAIGMTVLLTASSGIIGMVAGVPLVLLSRSRFAVLRIVYAAFVHVVRGVPPLVWLFVIFFGIAELGWVIAPVPSAIGTLSIIAAASMAEIYRGGLNAIGHGQYEAGWALSLSRWDVAKDIVLPQLLRAVSPTAATYFVGLLKDSALASIIGVAEITYVTNEQVTLNGHGLLLFSYAAAIYLVLSAVLGIVSRRLHARLTGRYAVV